MSATTILVVEDDQVNRELMAEMLTAHGYQVCQAEDGYRAIALARAERPRLIVMDLELPGLDGIGTTRRLKANPILRSIPIVIVTADGQFKKSLATAAGCDAFLSKPINTSMLLDVIAHLIV